MTNTGKIFGIEKTGLLFLVGACWWGSVLSFGGHGRLVVCRQF
jgi:hypothetical protein